MPYSQNPQNLMLFFYQPAETPCWQVFRNIQVIPPVYYPAALKILFPYFYRTNLGGCNRWFPVFSW